MKKSKLSLGLIACLLSVGSLAGCDKVKSSDDGVLLSYTVNGGKPISIKADDILAEYYDDSSKYQAIFDTIYSVIKVNFFNINYGRRKLPDGSYSKPLGTKQVQAIESEAKEKVENDKTTAQDNADANGTRYKKEFEAILEEKGVTSEKELEEKYIEEIKKETFDENLYNYFVDEIRGETEVDSFNLKGGKKFKWNGYLKDQSPYHMSHLMVELADSSDTNYFNGTISKENAKNLYNVVKELASGEQSFRYLAGTLSDDTSSRDKSGDLGIMDYDTSFINEFKLGIYAYEQLYLNRTPSYGGVESKTKISTDIANNDAKSYREKTKELFKLNDENDIPTVPLWVFESLNAYAEKENDVNSKPVIEGAELVFPRNVMYNKYLNRHAVFFIDNGEVYDNDHPEAYSGYTDEKDNGNFHVVDFNGIKKVVLCADDDPTKPIVTVRGSSGGKQEIHFMVVNRSPFDAAAEAEVSLDKYYTTYYYEQSTYPKDADKNKLDTYTNFISEETKDSKPRAEEVVSKLKSYDSDKLQKFAFLRFKEIEKLEFTKDCEAIETALMNWIATSVEKKENEAKESWAKTWDEYLDKLARQNQERKKLVPEISVDFFDYANDTELKLQDVVEFDDLSASDLEEIRNSAQIMDITADKDSIANKLYGKDYEALDLAQKGVVDAYFAALAKDGTIDDKEIEYYWNTTSVADAFKREGGIFNDGKDHN